MFTVANQIRDYFNASFIRHLEADMMMTDEERAMSRARAVSYWKQWEAYRDDQRKKYGIEGGPSPAIVFKDRFEPHV